PIANRTNDYLIDRAMQRTRNFSGLASTGTEDIAMAESMGQIVDRRTEHLGTADLPIIVMRRILLRMVRECEQGIQPDAASHGDSYGFGPLGVDDPEGDFQRLLDLHDLAIKITV